MCREGRGPSMSVPVDFERDDDVYITETLKQCATRLRAAGSAGQPAGTWRPQDAKSLAELQKMQADVMAEISRRVLGDPMKGVGLPTPPAAGGE